MASRRCMKTVASRIASSPSAASAKNAPSIKSSRRRSLSFDAIAGRDCEERCAIDDDASVAIAFALNSRGARASIAAYSSDVFACTGNCLRACLSFSAKSIRSKRRTPSG